MKSDRDDEFTLKQDAALDEPLKRVAYEAGMMLGLDATQAEQDYHRRRLTRQQYWLAGFGTLAGMAVSMDPPGHTNSTDEISVRLIVGPGVGIDQLGREVLIYEPYCIQLGEWLAAQSETALRDGFIQADERLWLNVTVRHRDCPVSKQPVLARKLNLSTDAVQPSRIADSVLLELVPSLPPDPPETGFRLWGNHPTLPEVVTDELTPSDQTVLAEVAGTPDEPMVTLHARMLQALSNGVGSIDLEDRLAENARLLLARVSIEVSDVNAIGVNPERISINNLVRPFLVSAGQLAWLSRQSGM